MANDNKIVLEVEVKDISQVEKLTNDLNKLKSELESLDTKKLGSSIKDIDQLSEDLSKAIGTISKEITDLTTSTNKIDLSGFTKNFSSISTQFDELVKQFSKLDSIKSISDQDNKVKDLTKSLVKLNKELTDSIDKFGDLATVQAKAAKAASNSSVGTGTYTEGYDKFIEDRKKLQDDIKNNTADPKAYSEGYKQANRDLKEVEKEMIKSTAKLRENQQEVQKSARGVQNVFQDIANANSSIFKTRVQFNNALDAFGQYTRGHIFLGSMNLVRIAASNAAGSLLSFGTASSFAIGLLVPLIGHFRDYEQQVQAGTLTTDSFSDLINSKLHQAFQFIGSVIRDTTDDFAEFVNFMSGKRSQKDIEATNKWLSSTDKILEKLRKTSDSSANAMYRFIVRGTEYSKLSLVSFQDYLKEVEAGETTLNSTIKINMLSLVDMQNDYENLVKTVSNLDREQQKNLKNTDITNEVRQQRFLDYQDARGKEIDKFRKKYEQLGLFTDSFYRQEILQLIASSKSYEDMTNKKIKADRKYHTSQSNLHTFTDINELDNQLHQLNSYYNSYQVLYSKAEDDYLKKQSELANKQVQLNELVELSDQNKNNQFKLNLKQFNDYIDNLNLRLKEGSKFLLQYQKELQILPDDTFWQNILDNSNLIFNRFLMQYRNFNKDITEEYQEYNIFSKILGQGADIERTINSNDSISFILETAQFEIYELLKLRDQYIDKYGTTEESRSVINEYFNREIIKSNQKMYNSLNDLSQKNLDIYNKKLEIAFNSEIERDEYYEQNKLIMLNDSYQKELELEQTKIDAIKSLDDDVKGWLYANEEDYQNALIELEYKTDQIKERIHQNNVKRIQVEQKLEQEKIAIMAEVTNQLGEFIAVNAGNSKNDIMIKYAIAQIQNMLNLSTAISSAIAANATGDPYTMIPRIIASVGAIGVTFAQANKALNEAKSQSIPEFHPRRVNGYKDGGIVGGNSYTGDRIPIRVNSGEMILNKDQQRSLFNILDNNLLASKNISEQPTVLVYEQFDRFQRNTIKYQQLKR